MFENSSSILSRYSNQKLQGAATNGNLGIFGAYGGHGGMIGGTDCFTIDICPDLLLAAFAAAAAAAFWLIYTAITQNAGRRKKRSALQNLGNCIYTFGKNISNVKKSDFDFCNLNIHSISNFGLNAAFA